MNTAGLLFPGKYCSIFFSLGLKKFGIPVDLVIIKCSTSYKLYPFSIKCRCDLGINFSVVIIYRFASGRVPLTELAVSWLIIFFYLMIR
jgi:hypothetical protein